MRGLIRGILFCFVIAMGSGIMVVKMISALRSGSAVALGIRDHLSGDPDVWVIKSTNDPLTGVSTDEVVRKIRTKNGTVILLRADCRTLGEGFLTIQIFAVRATFTDQAGAAINIDTNGFAENGMGQIRASFVQGEELDLSALLIHSNDIQLRPSIAEPVAFENAKFFKVSIPLLNGETPVFDLRPQDAPLKIAFADCVAARN